jgi:hypothetical protein
MNTYDQKHLELLELIHSGQWQNIPDKDANELQVLVACKYVIINSSAPGLAQLTLNPEGQRYLERLSGIKAMKFQSSRPAEAMAHVRA